MKSFGSDNHSGVCPEAMAAIAAANSGHALAYGDDEITLRLTELFRREFGHTASPYLVFNGTGANILCLDALCRSHHAVVCAETAHINVDECGAPQRAIGCRLLPVATPDGKLTPDLVRTQLHGFGFEHHSQPRAISISNVTELGTVYTPDEVCTLAELAHSNGMYLHMDGARLANAAASLGCTLKEITTDCGVDALSFGGTKNGMMCAESAVILNPDLDVDLRYRRKQLTQLSSKMRFMAAQFEAYLVFGGQCSVSSDAAASASLSTFHFPLSTEPLWLRNAQHSNRMARLLEEAVRKVDGVEVMYPVQANSVFARLPREVWQRLLEKHFFYDWDFDANVVRWMCSFDTTEEDIAQFASDLSASF